MYLFLILVDELKHRLEGTVSPALIASGLMLPLYITISEVVVT